VGGGGLVSEWGCDLGLMGGGGGVGGGGVGGGGGGGGGGFVGGVGLWGVGGGGGWGGVGRGGVPGCLFSPAVRGGGKRKPKENLKKNRLCPPK